MSKKLNEQGLSHLLLKLKSIFAAKQHSHTKSEVGLSKVDNTSDAEKSVKYAATATFDSSGQQINSTYIKNVSVDKNTIIITKGDNIKEKSNINIVANSSGYKDNGEYKLKKAALHYYEFSSWGNDDNEALFVSMRNPYNRLLKPAIEYLIKAISKKAGLTRHIFPHLFRNTLATNMLKHGGDITSIQTILGHSNIQTTLIYARQDDRKVKKDHARCIA